MSQKSKKTKKNKKLEEQRTPEEEAELEKQKVNISRAVGPRSVTDSEVKPVAHVGFPSLLSG